MRLVALSGILILLLSVMGRPTIVHQQTPEAERREMTLDFSSYYGGSETDWAMEVCLDDDGNCIVAGYTESDDLSTQNAHQDTYGGEGDAYLIKLDSEYQVVFASYFGGSDFDEIRAMITDDDGNIIVAGQSSSDDLDVLNAIQGNRTGESDCFVAKFSPNGTLLFASYLGGSEEEWPEGICLDHQGNYVIAGQTSSDDFNVTSGVFQEDYGGGTQDGVIFALSPDGQSLLYGSYFGVEHGETILNINNDPGTGFAIVGLGYGGAPVTGSAYQQDYGGGLSDGFVARFTAGCQSLTWSTMLGGDGWEFPDFIEFDLSGDLIVSGYSGSSDFPLIDQLFNDSGSYDAILVKLSSDGSELLKSTHVGGEREDRSYGMDLLSDDAVMFTASAASDGLPAPHAFQENNSGGADVYVAILQEGAWEIEFASYIGGARNDYPIDIALVNDSYVAVIGSTSSDDFPTENEIQTERTGSDDIFICVLHIRLVVEQPHPGFPVEIVLVSVVVVGILAVVYLVIRRQR